MGYQTFHTLVHDSKDHEVTAAIHKALLASNGADDMSLALGVYDWTSPSNEYKRGEPCSWPDRDVVMMAVSAQFPEVLFTISGVGDRPTDFWKAYYKSGKFELVRGRIIFDECSL